MAIYYLNSSDDINFDCMPDYGADLHSFNTSVPGSSTVSGGTSNTSYVLADVWEREGNYSGITSWNFSADVSWAGTGEYCFRVSRRDGSCTTTDWSAQSSNFNTSGIKTETLSMTWGTGTAFLRFELWVRRISGGPVLCEITTGSDSFIQIASSYDDTASGGLRGGGTVPPQKIMSPPTSGGSLAAGVATNFITSTRIASGGALVGGTFNVVQVHFGTGSGGGLVSGTSNISLTYYSTSTGGGLVSGDAIVGGTTSETASGGALVSGSSSIQKTVSVESAGGVLVSGQILITFANGFTTRFSIEVPPGSVSEDLDNHQFSVVFDKVLTSIRFEDQSGNHLPHDLRRNNGSRIWAVVRTPIALAGESIWVYYA